MLCLCDNAICSHCIHSAVVASSVRQCASLPPSLSLSLSLSFYMLCLCDNAICSHCIHSAVVASSVRQCASLTGSLSLSLSLSLSVTQCASLTGFVSCAGCVMTTCLCTARPQGTSERTRGTLFPRQHSAYLSTRCWRRFVSILCAGEVGGEGGGENRPDICTAVFCMHIYLFFLRLNMVTRRENGNFLLAR